MKIKTKWKLLFIAGLATATLIPLTYSIACNADDIKSFFNKVLNAVKAIQSLGRGEKL